MSELRGRASNRIFFQAPARLRGADGLFDARIEDISSTGIRLRVTRHDLELAPEGGIGAAAACVRHRLGSAFHATLDAGQEGLGILKRLSLVRLSLPDAAPEHLDLGCLFEEPLTDRDALALGLDLQVEDPKRLHVRRPAAFGGGKSARPTPRTALPESRPEVPLYAPGSPRPPAEHVPVRALRAVVAPAPSQGQELLLCQTESFTVHSVLIRARGSVIPFRRAAGETGATSAALEFTEHYGERLHLELVEGTRSVWRGPTHVCGVELDPAHRRDILVRLAFGRPLQDVEVARLRGQ